MFDRWLYMSHTREKLLDFYHWVEVAAVEVIFKQLAGHFSI